MKILAFYCILIMLSPIAEVHGGLGAIAIGYGVCQSLCNAGFVACCTALGVTAGTFTAGAAVPAAVAGCSLAQGGCMAACAAACVIAPTP